MNDQKKIRMATISNKHYRMTIVGELKAAEAIRAAYPELKHGRIRLWQDWEGIIATYLPWIGQLEKR